MGYDSTMMAWPSQLPDGVRARGALTVAGDLTAEADIITGVGTKQDGRVTSLLTETQTTDATETTVFTRSLDDENTYFVECEVTGVKSDGSQRAAYKLVAVVFRTGGVSSAIQGSVTSLHTEESDSDWDCNIKADGNNVIITVTGKAATTVEWSGHVTMTNMSN